MFPPLHQRGADSCAEFEAAAEQRFVEAERLHKGSRHLGAIYLFGYSVEMRVKALYFRNAGFGARQQISPQHRTDARAMATALGLTAQPGQHDLAGWAQLAVAARATCPVPYSSDLGNSIVNQATALYLIWRETLRYRATRPIGRELHDPRRIASWFRSQYATML